MASNALTSLATKLTSSLPTTLRQDPRAATTTVALTVGLTALGLSIPTLTYLNRNYRAYLALGPGGLPHNLLGWALQGLLQLIARRNTRDPAPLTDPRNRSPYEPHGTTSYLAISSPIPPRRGGADGDRRPTVPSYVAPQRQTDQRPADAVAMHARMSAFLEAVAARNAGVLVLRPSGLERRDEMAVCLEVEKETMMPGFLKGIKGESAHAHGECSSHVVLSMVDAEELVRKGWAERHMLSGVAMMPWSYMFVYAPRDDAEFEVWKSIVEAGLRFVCASAGKEARFDV